MGLDTADNNKAWLGSTESERGGFDTGHTIKHGSEDRHPTESNPGEWKGGLDPASKDRH